MCTGKIYFDLIEAREKNKNDEVVFIRIAQHQLNIFMYLEDK